MMPRYEVEVEYAVVRTLRVWARDEEAAREKAAEIVEDWDGVQWAQGQKAEEVEE